MILDARVRAGWIEAPEPAPASEAHDEARRGRLKGRGNDGLGKARAQ